MADVVHLRYFRYAVYAGIRLEDFGIFSSARHISRDAQVRKEFYKSASSQLTFLQTIGVSQMEKELKVQVNSLDERFKPLETTDEPELRDEGIKKSYMKY